MKLSELYSPEEAKRLEVRHAVVRAWEQKYGEVAPRVVTSFLMVAAPDEVVARFGRKPRITPGLAAVVGWDEEWTPILGGDPLRPEFSGDSKSLAAEMVPVYVEAFKRKRGREPSKAELEVEMGVGRLETLWGTGWSGMGRGSKNHGAVQAGKGPCDPSSTFEYVDTHPLDSGGSEKYTICFKRYDTDVDGAADVVKHVGNDPLRMLKSAGGYVPAFSLGLYGNHYFEGFNAPPSVIKSNLRAFNWIMSHAKKPPSGTNQWFKDGIARAADPIHAGRVLNHAVALNKAIKSTTSSLGVKRATTMDAPLVGAREVGAGAVGALVGAMTGTGPLGIGVGALAGAIAGRATR